MPAVITHDSFGQDVYHSLYEIIGGSKKEADAFLLGNQGPDPLFYSVIDLRLRSVHKLGNRMHSCNPNQLLAAFKESLKLLGDDERAIGRAYALGFLCHYLLDRSMHPLVYAQQYALCDAGEPDLGREDGNEVHAVIESEFDEMVLFTKRGETVQSFNPSKQILRADGDVLDIISKMYAYVALRVFSLDIPSNAFRASVKHFRLVQSVFHSPTGIKREGLARIEEKLRRYSFYRAMSHRPKELETSQFANDEHETWVNPFTDEECTDSFWNRFETAKSAVGDAFAAFDSDGFNIETAERITHNLDFSGQPTCALIISVEDHDGTADRESDAAETPESATGADDSETAFEYDAESPCSK